MVIWEWRISWASRSTFSYKNEGRRKRTNNPHDPKTIIDVSLQLFPLFRCRAQPNCHATITSQPMSPAPCNLVTISKRDSRFHNNQSKFLHLPDPLLVLLSKPRNTRPLVLAPQRLCLVWVRYGLIEIDSFMVVSFPVRYILLEPLVAYMNESDDLIDEVGPWSR